MTFEQFQLLDVETQQSVYEALMGLYEGCEGNAHHTYCWCASDESNGLVGSPTPIGSCDCGMEDVYDHAYTTVMAAWTQAEELQGS